jgi:glyoxylase-like metal-dependent hydrolase (beta-lactamase superfamily II)
MLDAGYGLYHVNVMESTTAIFSSMRRTVVAKTRAERRALRAATLIVIALRRALTIAPPGKTMAASLLMLFQTLVKASVIWVKDFCASKGADLEVMIVTHHTHFDHIGGGLSVIKANTTLHMLESLMAGAVTFTANHDSKPKVSTI